MAKKKGRTQSRKKKKQTSPFLSAVRKMFVWACLLVACFIGLMFLYNYSSSFRGQQKETEQPDGKPSSAFKAEEDFGTSSNSAFKMPLKAEIPVLRVKHKEQIIQHEGYTVSYNSDYKIANWVAYELTSEEAKSKKAERSNKFVPDPLVKGATAKNEDYTRTGYDRGHMAPAGDMKWSVKAMRESFYFSNICPQEPGLNRGIWKELEEECRLWAMDNEALWIVTGPVISDDLKRLGKNRVGIPRTFYKVICRVVGNKPQTIAFLFENKDYKNTSLKSMAITVDSVEKVTGIDFFSSFPDTIEKQMEASVNPDSWSF